MADLLYTVKQFLGDDRLLHIGDDLLLLYGVADDLRIRTWLTRSFRLRISVRIYMRTEIAVAFEKKIAFFCPKRYNRHIPKTRGRIHAKTATVPPDLRRTTS